MKTSHRKAANAKRARRYQQGRGAAHRTDLVAANPVAQAMARHRIEADLRALRTRAGIHAHMGDDTAQLADACGCVVFIVAHAMGLHHLGETPEARILMGTANALGDVVQYPSMLDSNRAAILSGLDACERMLPHLHTWALYAGAVELDRLLSGRDFTSGDVRVALGHAA